jgi:hypothetical protein
MRQLKISLPDRLREQLNSSSAASGRSLGDEIRQRLERSCAEGQVDRRTRGLMEAVAEFARLVEFEIGPWHASLNARQTLDQLISLWLQRRVPSRTFGDLDPLPTGAASGLGLGAAGLFGTRDPNILAEKLYRFYEFAKPDLLNPEKGETS